ncbi:flavodoxin family protein [Mycobacterium sp. CVI_P3]|uniref:Flavodoxin family protein n=1 Tax=Mycobacterium pinniadriaticum TaxID=2994102 RepID=A0ABT3SAH5_9MYCO|nr:flavodoxin family protein [Mycobacterium pinniadriaticum]MCX2929841.1 flavodoxin family protein [Mycobacterium pinniadriaticum]MCX2936510.1 flavodoxin family protein [Mycobacterium pinniadriaticum]
MKTLIICVSVSHGNTRRVADRMAEVLSAEVVDPEAVDIDQITQYDLVGFGSGVYFMSAHPRLWRLVRRLPHVDGTPAFTLFTSGAAEVPLVGYSRPIRWGIARKGFRLLSSYSCRGLDTVGPLGWIGGVNKGRPSERDLEAAAAFATRVRNRIQPSAATS